MVFNWFKRNKGKAEEESGDTSASVPESQVEPAPPTPTPQQGESAAPPEETPVTEAALTPAGTIASASDHAPVAPSSTKPDDDTRGARSEADAEAPRRGLFGRLREGLRRSREQISASVEQLVLGKKVIDDELLEDLEAILLQADMGVAATRDIMDRVTQRVRRNELKDPAALRAAIRQALLDILQPRAQPWTPAKGQTQVLMMVGINGAGKTTTIGKLAARWKAEGYSILLGAGDTFRAAAVEQLTGWAERVQVPVIAQGAGADSASVLYDAYAAARARGIDLVIADTAGRLHTQGHLMEELKKVKRVLAKQDPGAPHQIWLVLDAGTGQNALQQVQQFHEAVGLTGICITKLDGTAKGGVVAAVAKALPLPIRFIGVGEGVEDLRPFSAEAFVDALVAETGS
ncbi:MAG: signal recognition particle-docking protein FtsY [Acidithiobacillus caldus]|jgi:fused signal recognition particle receptor|nr:signal recognition particle-docking protein FtsY [Acidithiobacillus caldus]MBU2790315.1 signal recognition particle-docking protein FtsY [Acidithiobacillus caldus]MBU2803198.1 signal recognition particle-docking protein FtsY [Acidithiobacillus caldus]MBU2820615.1 signal recognition particle-docking protein FtsY [Acidithiobacillus caldus]MCY0873025.1 signal recognition particle-docking protein FtsY [Acidithiobacillus caldus]WMT46552.1 MAG: signal recognition particle-docking protein FtsY [Ac